MGVFNRWYRFSLLFYVDNLIKILFCFKCRIVAYVAPLSCAVCFLDACRLPEAAIVVAGIAGALTWMMLPSQP